MPVVGVNFTKITANANNDRLEAGQINVSTAPRIYKLEKKDINVGTIRSVVEISFDFTVKYEPNVGEIKFEGSVLYDCDNPEKIVKTWKEKKELDKSIIVEVMNIIFRQSLTKAIVISSDLKLPTPIRFPVVQMKDDNGKK